MVGGLLLSGAVLQVWLVFFAPCSRRRGAVKVVVASKQGKLELAPLGQRWARKQGLGRGSGGAAFQVLLAS